MWKEKETNELVICKTCALFNYCDNYSKSIDKLKEKKKKILGKSGCSSPFDYLPIKTLKKNRF